MLCYSWVLFYRRVAMRYQTFLFDLDGTLVDTAPDLAAAVNLVRTVRGLSPLPENELRPYASRGAPGLLGKAMNVNKTDTDFPELRAEFLANYQSAMTVHSCTFEGVLELLDTLRAHGIKTGVVTNKYAHLAQPLVEDLGLTDRLDIVLGSDSDGCAMKPAPDSLLTAAKQLNVAPETILYAGDDPRDIQAAHNAGILAASVRWGYGLTDPNTWGADFVAQTPLDLYRWLLQLNEVDI